MPKAMSLEKVKDKLYKKHNNKIEISNYIKVGAKATFKCNICDHQWKTTVDSVINLGTGCPQCYKENKGDDRKYTYEFVKSYIESKGYQLLSLSYNGCFEKLLIKCPCGNEFPMAFSVFKAGHRCPVCQQIKNNLRQRPVEKIFEILKENNLVFIEFPNKYIDGKSEITYKCKHNHITTKTVKNFMISPSCQECVNIYTSIRQRGEKANNWKGGTTKLNANLKPLMKEWKIASIRNCNYKCIITGDSFDDVHHLYGFNLILDEAIKNLGFNNKNILGDCNNEELILIINEVKELHNKYPLGVCLSRKIHTLFHSIYGFKNNTPEQFYEFKAKIESGEIKLDQVA